MGMLFFPLFHFIEAGVFKEDQERSPKVTESENRGG